MNYRNVDCHCCGSQPSRHVNLYTSGSEGVMLCCRCNIAVTNMVQAMIGIGGTAKMAGFKMAKRERQTEATHEQENKIR